MSFLSMMPEERIDSWRQRVPSRLERRDPFEGDGFDERPATRLVSHSHETLWNKSDHLLADFP
jgi:Ras family protein A